MPTYILGMAAVSMYIRKFTSIEFKLSTSEYLKLVVKSLATIWALKFQYKLFLNWSQSNYFEKKWFLMITYFNLPRDNDKAVESVPRLC